MIFPLEGGEVRTGWWSRITVKKPPLVTPPRRVGKPGVNSKIVVFFQYEQMKYVWVDDPRITVKEPPIVNLPRSVGKPGVNSTIAIFFPIRAGEASMGWWLRITVKEPPLITTPKRWQAWRKFQDSDFFSNNEQVKYVLHAPARMHKRAKTTSAPPPPTARLG